MKPADYKEYCEYVRLHSSDLLLVDQHQVQTRLRAIQGAIQSGASTEAKIENLARVFEESQKRKASRLFDYSTITYPADLPISAYGEKIRKALSDHRLLIICGDTGSGKTTQLAKMALEAGLGKTGRIGVTQPRRLATTSMAQRVADELRCALGGPVGFQIRFEERISAQTIVKFMTDGILLAEIARDRNLLQYDALIIDEAHERSLNIDFILGYIKELLLRRPDLKVVVSSATLDAAVFSRFFEDAPVITVQGRSFPIADTFRPPAVEDEAEVSVQVLDAIEWIKREDAVGDILVFLPGEREIKETADLLKGRQWPAFEILPLFGRLSMSDQHRVFRRGSGRRVILATNVAETSLTIPNIRFVVESGLVRLSRYNPYTHVQSLQIEQVSQASARQRRGRCGRVAEGRCVYLYSRELLEQSAPYTDPEILRTSLAGVILQMKMLGLPPIERFAFINPPPSVLIREGYKSLRNLRALDKDDHLTPLGRQMAAFPLDPHLSRMVCQANVEGVLTEVLVIAAFLSIRDPRERPAEKQTLADQCHQLWSDKRSDFIAILNLWKGIEDKRKENPSNQAIRAFCKAHFLNYGRIQEWRNLGSDLSAVCRRFSWKVASETSIQSDYDRIHRSLLAGLPISIGRMGEQRTYQAPGDRKFHIFPGSGLFKQTYPCVMAFALVETTKLYARLVAQIDPAWLEDIAPHLCQFHYRDIHYSPKEGFVYALKTVTLSGLVIQPGRKVHYGSIDPADARRLFIEEGMVQANLHSRHRWLIEHRQMLQHISELEARMRKPGCLLDEKAIFDHFDKLLPSTVYSAQSLDKWLDKSGADLTIKTEDAIVGLSASSLTEEYPETLVYNGHPFKLAYGYAPGEENDGVSLICPTDLIWLLPSWALDWLVPGWLVEKVHALIRSLPKPLRMACSPTMNRAGDFVKLVRTGSIDSHQSLLDALIGYLGESCGVAIKSTDFDPSRLPSYLSMKLIEVDAKGRQVRAHHAVPDRQAYTSKLSSSLGAVKEWNKTGTTEWPGQSLPDTVFLNETRDLVGYPALVDEGTHVCQRVFLDEQEAKYAHRAGVIRLFRLQRQEDIRRIEKELPLPDYAKLSLRSLDPTGGWAGDLIEVTIWEAMTDKGRHAIRAPETYQTRSEAARGQLYPIAAAKSALLNDILKSRGRVMDKCKTLQGCKDNLRDIEGQLSFLFRPGFIKDQQVWECYPRYLKALYIRLERLAYSSVKDLAKLNDIKPLCIRFDEELQKIKSPELAFHLWEFAHLLQEYRVALFAPEVGTSQKISKKRLERFWDEHIEKKQTL